MRTAILILFVAAGFALSGCSGDYASSSTIQQRCRDHGGVAQVDENYYVICRDGHLTTNRK